MYDLIIFSNQTYCTCGYYYINLPGEIKDYYSGDSIIKKGKEEGMEKRESEGNSRIFVINSGHMTEPLVTCNIPT